MLKTMRQARDKAVEIVGEAQVDANKLRQIMDEEMEKLSKEQLSDYKETLHTISKDIEEEVKSEAQELKKVAETEIEEYKQAKYKQIEEGAVAALEKVGREVVGKTLDFREHTDLIISALEKAKQQNVI